MGGGRGNKESSICTLGLTTHQFLAHTHTLRFSILTPLHMHFFLCRLAFSSHDLIIPHPSCSSLDATCLETSSDHLPKFHYSLFSLIFSYFIFKLKKIVMFSHYYKSSLKTEIPSFCSQLNSYDLGESGTQ